MTPLPAGRIRPLAGGLALAAIALLACGLRLGHQAQIGASPLGRHLILDEAYNDAWAARLAAGEPGVPLPFFRAPLYPALLGAAYRACGHDPAAARAIQAALSALTCLLAFRVAARGFGRSAGYAAALLAATYWPWIYADAELQDVPLALFLNLAALACTQEAGRRARGGAWAAGAGLALGLSAITRPTVLVTVPVLLGWLCWQEAPPRRRLAAAALFVLGAAVAIAPVAWLNRVRGGDRVLIASQGGLNFYIGNHHGADGHSARLPGASAEWEGMIADAERAAEAARGRPLRPSEVSDYWYSEGRRFWRERPAEAAGLLLRKIGYLLASPEIPNDKPIRFVIDSYAPLLRLPWPGFGIVLPLALVGLLWGGDRRQAILLGGFAATYGLGVAAFFVSSRHRLPMAAIAILLAGAGIAAVARRLRQRSGWRAPAAALLAALVVVNLPALWHRENLAHGRYLLGNAYRRDGDPQRAAAEYRAALALQPAFPEARRNLGAALLAAGRPEEAEEALREPPGEPPDPESRFNRALALQRLGRRREAIRLLEETAAAVPADPEAWLRLGNARSQDGDLRGAEAAFARADSLAPERPEPGFNLGNALLAQGRLEEAAGRFLEVLRRHPDHAGCWTNLGIARLQQGRLAEALAALGNGAARAPGSASAHLALGRALQAAGRGDEARAAYAAAVRAEPGSEAARLAAEELSRSSPSG